MLKESKLMLADFVCKDRFELNSYLTHLFHQFNTVAEQSKYKINYIILS